MHQFKDNWQLQSIIFAGQGSVTTSSKKALGNQTAKAKFKTKTCGFESNVGYKIHLQDELTVTPTVGVKYAQFSEGAYTEKDAALQNIVTEKRSASQFSGVIGAKCSIDKRLSEQALIIPGVHAFIEHKLQNKQPKVKSRFTWMEEYFEDGIGPKKENKTLYNLGASVVMQNKSLELSTAYNCILKKKYVSHQGSIKFKVTF